MSEIFEVDIKGYNAKLPLIKISEKITIAFFNLHGDSKLTEHCGKELSKLVGDSDVLITAESKGLQLTHVVARESGLYDYAVARKSKKLYGYVLTLDNEMKNYLVGFSRIIFITFFKLIN